MSEGPFLAQAILSRLLPAALFATIALGILYVVGEYLVRDGIPVLMGIVGCSTSLGASVGALTGRTRIGAVAGLGLGLLVTACIVLWFGIHIIN